MMRDMLNAKCAIFIIKVPIEAIL